MAWPRQAFVEIPLTVFSNKSWRAGARVAAHTVHTLSSIHTPRFPGARLGGTIIHIPFTLEPYKARNRWISLYVSTDHFKEHLMCFWYYFLGHLGVIWDSYFYTPNITSSAFEHFVPSFLNSKLLNECLKGSFYSSPPVCVFMYIRYMQTHHVFQVGRRRWSGWWGWCKFLHGGRAWSGIHQHHTHSSPPGSLVYTGTMKKRFAHCVL